MIKLDYSESLRDYINIILKKNLPFWYKIGKEDIYVYLKIDGSDIVKFHINRDLNKNSYFEFINGCPSGSFKLSKTNVLNVINLLKK